MQCPTGKSRLTLLGTKGIIELRMYVDVGVGETVTVNLMHVDRCEKIDASDAGLYYCASFPNNIR